MVVLGYTVPEALILAFDAFVKEKPSFKAKELEKIAEDHVPGALVASGVAMRVVDRYLQKARKTGKIETIGAGLWRRLPV